MAEYSSCSDTESYDSSSDEEIEQVIKKVPKAEVPEVKPKRAYNRKPMTEDQKKVLVDKLAKARAAKKVKADEQKQKAAQEAAELKAIKKLKDEGKIKVKKDKPAPIEVPKKVKEKKEKVVVREIHHHYDSKPAETKPAKAPKTPREPAPPKPPPPPRMVFA